MIQNNLELKPDLLAQLLFGTLDQRARVVRLTTLAKQAWAAALESERKAQVPISEGACYLNDVPQLLPILQTMENVQLEGTISLEHAAQLNQEGLQIRMTDFERARGYFIQAARMVCQLMQAGVQGASRMELEWYLASYCAASAGLYYFRSEYIQAKAYYLAFFALAKETEQVWEKVHRLVEPLLSFYFIIAAGAYGELLEARPGRTHPARMAIALYMYPNETVRDRWLELAQELYTVNPAILRIVIRRLEILEQTAQIPGTRETRLALEAIVLKA